MSIILNIETSTSVCSVVVSSDNEIIFERIELQGPSHASLLGVFVDDAIKHLRKEAIKPDAVALSCGPGSYTGLRIGTSEAKGICFGFDIPLIAIHTPLVLTSGILKAGNDIAEGALLCPMIDARRMEVYAAIYNQNLEVIRAIQADIVDEHSYADFLDKSKVLFFGDGAAKCKDSLIHPNAVFVDNIYPLASNMINLANAAFDKSDFVDLAYFEPFYLKEFVATTPKKLF